MRTQGLEPLEGFIREEVWSLDAIGAHKQKKGLDLLSHHTFGRNRIVPVTPPASEETIEIDEKEFGGGPLLYISL
jgi:hypothetical protein